MDNMGEVYSVLLVLGGLYPLLLEFAERRWRLVDQVTFIWGIAGTLIVVLTVGPMVSGSLLGSHHVGLPAGFRRLRVAHQHPLHVAHRRAAAPATSHSGRNR